MSDIVPFYEGLLLESERSMGILAFAFIESQIDDLFRQNLNPNVQGGIESILGPNGILDTIGSRITMLHALSWIADQTQHNLKLLARIRNRFAHSHKVLTFDDKIIDGLLSSISKHDEGLAQHYPDEYSVPLLKKHVFLVRSLMTLFSFYVEATLMPAALRSGMGPFEAIRAGFDRWPVHLQDATASCIGAVRRVYGDAKKDRGGNG